MDPEASSLQMSRPNASAEAGRLQASMLFNILPSAVQTRIPKIPSIRKIIGSYKMKNDRRSVDFSQQRWADGLEVGFVGEASVTSLPSLSRPSSSRSSLIGPPSPDGGCECILSREWRYAANGINLLETVVSEAQYPSSRSQSFSRQQYISSLVYLLHGVPEDLSQHEKETLRAALPEQLLNPPQADNPPPDSHSSRDRSLIHRFLACSIVQVFLFIQLFLPYLRYFVRILYNFERSNNISERALAIGISALESLGKRGSDIVGTVLRGGNGRIIHLAAALWIWWIKEVSSAIHEGVEECVGMSEQSKGMGAKT